MDNSKETTCTLTMSSDAWAALCVAIEEAAQSESPIQDHFVEAAKAVSRFYLDGEGCK